MTQVRFNITLLSFQCFNRIEQPCAKASGLLIMGLRVRSRAKIGVFSPEEFGKIRVWARLSSSHDAGLTT